MDALKGLKFGVKGKLQDWASNNLALHPVSYGHETTQTTPHDMRAQVEESCATKTLPPTLPPYPLEA